MEEYDKTPKNTEYRLQRDEYTGESGKKENFLQGR